MLRSYYSQFDEQFSLYLLQDLKVLEQFVDEVYSILKSKKFCKDLLMKFIPFLKVSTQEIFSIALTIFTQKLCLLWKKKK